MEANPNPSPETKANIISKLFFWWIFPFVRHSYKHGLQMTDIYDTSEIHKSGNVGSVLEKNWETEVKNTTKRKEGPSLLRVIIKTYGFAYMELGLWLLLLLIVISCSKPYILSMYIKFFRENYKIEVGWITAFGYIIINILTALVYAHYFAYSQIFGLNAKVACCSLVYRKLMKLSLTSLSKTASGELINLISNDLQRIETASIYIHYIYALFLQSILLCYIIYDFIGISCLPGILFVIFEGLAIQGYLSKIQGKLRLKIAQLTGNRLVVMNGLVSGIQVIKMYAWEKPFEAVVSKARKIELSAISNSSYAKAATVAMVIFTERLSLFLTILMHVLLGNKLTSDVVFSVALLLNTFQVSLCYYLPLVLESYVEIRVSIRRLQEYLLLDEKAPPTVIKPVRISKDIGSIKVTDVRAGWLPNILTLTDISLNIKPGTLCCVLGKVGSGKTSFLHLLLKELPASRGRVDIIGKISYASQEPWLYVASVRNNILFGQKFLQNKYQEVVRVCALNRDFQQFHYRDQTMVGERGVSLSGGQRARINLARAIYYDADIYLLDDPLSAVDTHVAKHLFEECIKKHLRNKTRILVTHQLQFLKEADLIVVLEEGNIGKIMKNDEVCESSLNQLNEILPDTDENAEDKHTKSSLLKRTLSVRSHSSTATGYEDEVDQNEEKESKDISLSTYLTYLRSGTNTCVTIFILIIFILSQIFVNSSDLWIMYWTNQEEDSSSPIASHHNSTESDIYLLPEGINNINSSNLTHLVNISTNFYDTRENSDNTDSPTDYFYLYVYSGIILCCIVFSIVRPILFISICINASRTLHKRMLSGILQAPMRFFETNPSGRILNRFSKDLGIVDEILPSSMLWSFQLSLALSGILIAITIVTPWMILALIMAAAATYYMVVVCWPTLLNMVKLEANNISPIFSYIVGTMAGLPTIRSAEAEEMLKKYFDSLQDVHTSIQRMVILFSKMFGFYLECLWSLFVGAVTLQFLVYKQDNTHGGNVGMVISQASVVAGILQFTITKVTETMSAMVSVERIFQYKDIEKEMASEMTNRDKLMRRWPHSGKITFNKVSLTYVPGEQPVLNNLSFSIRAGEKIGIVGRTGAGKSSLITCLFRLAPIEGSVAIDDIDTAIVDFKTLRSKISIIPQEPVLFSESLRYNLDPLGTASDERLWKVLENVRLKDAIDNLDQKVNSGGSNFSVGQRQLICLARAILRNNKILVMDEATANVDSNTDELIQKTIRDNFSSCTVLTIAHRLNTIMDSDRVLVMSLGHVMEFAHPHELLQKSDSYFSEMVKETGKVVEETLRKVAKEDFEKKFFDMS